MGKEDPDAKGDPEVSKLKPLPKSLPPNAYVEAPASAAFLKASSALLPAARDPIPDPIDAPTGPPKYIPIALPITGAAFFNALVIFLKMPMIHTTNNLLFLQSYILVIALVVTLVLDNS